MNLQRAKILLDKANRLYQGIREDGDTPSAIERDLMLSYLRDLYELFLYEDKNNNAPVTVAAPKPTTKPKPPVTTPRKPVVMPMDLTPPPVSKPKPVVQEPVVVEQPKVVPPVVKEEPKVVEKPKPEIRPPFILPKEEKKPEPKPVQNDPPVVERPAINRKVAALFVEEHATDLSSRFSNAPIRNLKQGMGINERFLTINELFGGNAKQFNEAIDILNSFDKFSQAEAYLVRYFVDKYEWTDEDKQGKAKKFIKLVRRRYL